MSYRDRLKELNIPESVLIETIDTKALNAEQIYNRLVATIAHQKLPYDLKIKPVGQSYNFEFKEAWQLYALSGNVSFYAETLTQSVKKDSRGANLAHYAVLSGNEAAMDGLFKQAPDLLNTADYEGTTPINYAVATGQIVILDLFLKYNRALFFSDDANGLKLIFTACIYSNLDALSWIQQHFPELLNKHGNEMLLYAAMYGRTDVLTWVETHFPTFLAYCNEKGDTFVHIAARHGQTVVLDWAANHIPDLLTRKNKSGDTVAHCGARAGKVAIVDWVRINLPILLSNKANDGTNPVHCAAISGSAESLMSALNNTFSLDFLALDHYFNAEHVIRNVVTVLETNYSLTSVAFRYSLASRHMERPPQSLVNFQTQISEKTLRNKIIKQTKGEFSIFLQGASQNGSSIAKLPRDMLLLIFQQLLFNNLQAAKLTSKFSEATITEFFNEVMHYRKTIAIGLIKSNITHLEEKYSLLWFLKPSNADVNLLYELEKLVRKADTKGIQAWEERNKAIIEEKHNSLYAFFRPRSQTNMKQLATKVNEQLLKNTTNNPNCKFG